MINTSLDLVPQAFQLPQLHTKNESTNFIRRNGANETSLRLSLSLESSNPRENTAETQIQKLASCLFLGVVAVPCGTKSLVKNVLYHDLGELEKSN